MNIILRKLVKLKIICAVKDSKKQEYSLFGAAIFTTASLLSAYPEFALSEDIATLPGEKTPPFGSFFCSLSEAVEGINGINTYSAKEDYRRPPFRADFPIMDRESITYDGFSEDKRFYWYIKSEETKYGTYAIHGVFDSDSRILSSSRSTIMDLQNGGIGAIATSFQYLCTEIE